MPNKARILIVDDNLNNRFAIRTILKGIDAELHEAANGFDALTMALANRLRADFTRCAKCPKYPAMKSVNNYALMRVLPTPPVIFLTTDYKENSDKNARL